MGCHTKEPFTVGSSPLETVVSFFNLKLRMLCSKIRTLLISANWEQLQKKLTSIQRDCFLKLLRCLSSNFSCNGETEMHVVALPFLDELWLHLIFFGFCLVSFFFLLVFPCVSGWWLQESNKQGQQCEKFGMPSKGDCLSDDVL